MPTVGASGEHSAADRTVKIPGSWYIAILMPERLLASVLRNSIRHSQRMNVPTFFLASGQLVCWAGLYYGFPALLLEFESRFEVSRSRITLAMTLALLIAALLSPVAGRLIDRGSGRCLLAGGAVVGALALAGLTRASTVAQFYLGWAVIGAAMSATLYEPCFAFVVRHLRINANRAIGLITLIAGFAKHHRLSAGSLAQSALGARCGTVRILATGAGPGRTLPVAGCGSAG